MSEFLKNFYNASAFVFISPGVIYKYREDEKSFYYADKPSWRFQMLTWVIQTWAIVSMLAVELNIVEAAWNRPGKTTKTQKMFRLSIEMFQFLMIFYLYHTFRKHRRGFAKILNKINNLHEYLQEEDINLHSDNFIKSLSTVVIGCVLFHSLYSNLYVFHKLHTKSFQEMISYNTCGVLRHRCNTTNMEIILSGGHLVFGWLIFIGSLFSSVALATVDNLALVHTIVFSMIVRDYMRYLKYLEVQHVEQKLHHIRKVLLIFEEICGLSEQLDDIVGPFVAYKCFDILTFFATLLNELLTFEWVTVIQFSLYIVAMGPLLLLSSDANSQLGYLTYWLQNGLNSANTLLTSEKDEMVLNRRISLAINQLSRNQAGIRGRVFTLTYSFVGGMITLLITYSILFSQFNRAK